MPEEVKQPQPDLTVGATTIKGDEMERANVKRWTQRILAAKAKWKADFERMRECMEQAFGIQWQGQKNLGDDRYVANLTNRAVNQKVAMLYARDPRAVYRRRKRMEYQVWDEKLESLAAAVKRQSALMMHTGGLLSDPQSAAVIADYQQGRALKELVDKVGRTLEIVYQYCVDTQEPDFKCQMKQLVRRVITTGVGYVGVSFEREYETTLDSTTSHSSIIERVKKLAALSKKIEEKGGDMQAADAEQLQILVNSIGASVSRPGPEMEGLSERLVFDFIPSTSIIPDPCCRCLKGFVGAHWLVQEFVLPVDYVNAWFETDIKTGSDGAKVVGSDGEEATTQPPEGEQEPAQKPKRVALWHVYDLDTKSHLWLVDGHKEYVQRPGVLEPQVRGFFPIAAITFNDVEVEEGQKATIFPPSDVELMKHPQREWNRTRDGLRAHRKAKAPKWCVPKGVLSQNDLDAIESGKPCEAIELESVTKGDDMSKILMPFPHEPIDPAVYDTKVLSDDLMFAVGTQEANLGPARPNVTATVGNIAEQSRMAITSSNVDDLDDFLSTLARMGGEMCLREMSLQTVQRIVGPGAAWPEANRQDFLNSIYLETVAASSGRPNKAMELQNARELGPLLLQAGANPMFLVREFVKRLDDRLDPEEAFPLVPQGGGPGQGAPPPPPQPATAAGGPAVPNA